MRKPNAVRNLYGHVMHELGLRIVSGKVQPGDVLPREETLAESLLVSRTALREALKVLSAKGLIESRTHAGACWKNASGTSSMLTCWRGVAHRCLPTILSTSW